MKYLFILFLLVNLSQANRLTSFKIEGNRKTQKGTILSLSNIKIGDTITDSLLSQAKQNLMESSLFESVSIHNRDSSIITVTVEENRSIVPFFSVDATEKTLFLRAGLYDFNIAGRNTTVGGEYYFFDGTHNGKIYFSKPNLGERKLHLYTDFVVQNEFNTWYTKRGDIEAQFIVEQMKGTLQIVTPFTKQFSLSLGVHSSSENLLEKNNETGYNSVNRYYNHHFNGDNRTVTPEISLRYSTIDTKSLSYSGWGAEAYFGHTFQSDFDPYSTGSLELQWYKLLFRESNLCLKIDTKLTTGTNITSNLYVGGLNDVRGFYHNEFKGFAFVKTNLEYRIPSLKTDKVVLLHSLFMDQATIANRASSLGDFNTIWGFGSGVAVILPKIKNIMINSGYSFGMGEYRRSSFYIKTNHFFTPF